ncbi:hypothetical protein MUY21_12550 [Aliiroseovarius sp. S2029]|uniref:hypothetical protein n=1 Tax=Aliiroseovarius sp. S2029 TaxID=2936988 RepID=UPI0020BED7B7|nr:hypothetical protein [Aliiroseovarius sp. S2029]MCK8484869.1 hypothetical protein [Aliiroseovarius sp. S2029]
MRKTVGAQTYATGLKGPITNFQEELAQRDGRPDVRSGRLRALMKLETRRQDGHVSRRPALIPL